MADRVRRCDVAVVGAGPAGLSAAIQLGELGVDTLVVDEKPAAGGQLFKQIHKFFGSERHLAGVRGFEIGNLLLERLAALGVPILLDSPAWGLYPDRTLGVMHAGDPLAVVAKKVVIATGASENPLAFPGWTLPGVMGAGAAQTLVNYHRVRPGERALVVGAGNVGLIVAYQLLQAGIDVVAVAEGLPAVGGYAVHAAKIRRMSVPVYTRHTVLEAAGRGRVQRCTIAEVDDAFVPLEGTHKDFDVDMICVAVGLSPAVELLAAMDVALTYVSDLGGWVPLHDRSMATRHSGVYVAGDASGVEEASSAMEEGRQAAISAAAALGKISERRAGEMTRDVEQSLAALRRGPFGAAMNTAKQTVYERYCAS